MLRLSLENLYAKLDSVEPKLFGFVFKGFCRCFNVMIGFSSADGQIPQHNHNKFNAYFVYHFAYICISSV